MTFPGRSSASAKRANSAEANSKCFWSARVISAALHALCTMNRVTISPLFSAASLIRRSSSADARKLILCDLLVERLLTALGMRYSSVRTMYVHSRYYPVHFGLSMGCAVPVDGDNDECIGIPAHSPGCSRNHP